MRKKLLVGLFALSTVAAIFGFAACGGAGNGGGNNETGGGEDTPKHTHDYGTAWITDSTYHWHECQNDGCLEKIKDKAFHVDADEDGTCDICDYFLPEEDPDPSDENTTGLIFWHAEDGYWVSGYTDDKATVIEIPAEYSGEPVTGIMSDAFQLHPNLTTLTIPETVNTIQDWAFTNCVKLKTIYYNAIDCNNEYDGNNVFNTGGDYFTMVVGAKVKRVPASVGWGFCGRLDFEENSVCERLDADFRNDLESLTLPATLQNAGTFNTLYEGKIQVVNYLGDLQSWCAMDFSQGNPMKHAETFYFNGETVTNYEIPEGTEKIFEHAFYGCADMEELTVPSSVTEIGYGAFVDCDNLKTVRFNAKQCTGGGVFNDADKKTGFDLIMGNTVQKFPVTDDEWHDSMFFHSNVRTLSFEDNSICTAIPDKAFQGCKLLEFAFIPQSVERIGERIFLSCFSLKQIDYAAVSAKNDHETWGSFSIGTTEQGLYAYCSVLIKNTVKEIPDYLFNYKGFNVVQFEQNSVLKKIGDYAFSGSSIRVLQLPNTELEIGEWAFWKCPISSLVIPEKLVRLGGGAFSECSNLYKIDLRAKNLNSIGGGEQPEHYAAPFMSAGGLNLKIIVGNEVSEIAPWLFYSSSVRELEFEEKSVCKTIGESAFQNCPLKSLTNLPSSVNSIEARAFYSCPLERLIIGEGVTEIGSEAFAICTYLRDVTVPARIKNIGDVAYSSFYGCYKLILRCEAAEPIDWLDGNCYSPVVWNCKNNDIADDGYIYCLTDNGRYAIKDSVAMYDTDISISPKVTSVRILESVEYKDKKYSVTKIRSFAFSYYENLTDIVIPVTVTEIGSSAFENCLALKNIYYTGSPSDWKNITFDPPEYLYEHAYSNPCDIQGSTLFYYVENEADVPTDGGNYWHYVNGVPTVWGK